MKRLTFVFDWQTLRGAMSKQLLSQNALAQRSGASISTIRRALDEMPILSGNARRICEALSVTPEEVSK